MRNAMFGFAWYLDNRSYSFDTKFSVLSSWPWNSPTDISVLSARIDSRYVTFSQSLRKVFSQKLGIAYKRGNASFKLSLRYRRCSVKVSISFFNFSEKTFLKVLKKILKIR